MAKLQQQIADLKEAAGSGVGELSERDQLIAKQYEADQAKLQKIRLLLVSTPLKFNDQSYVYINSERCQTFYFVDD